MSGLDVLRIWARDYLKSRDSIFRQIESLEEGHDTIDIIRRGNKHLYLILPELDKAKIDKLEKDLRLTVVTYNTKKNLELLLSLWEEFKENVNLSFLFVNPNGETDIKWEVFPNVHDKISSEETLKPGLIAMFEVVGEYDI